MKFKNYGEKSMIQNQEKWANVIIEWLTVDRILEGMVHLNRSNEAPDMQYLLSYIFTSSKDSYLAWHETPDILHELTNEDVLDIDEIFEYEDWIKILSMKTGIKFYEYETYRQGAHCANIDYKYEFNPYDEDYEHYAIIKKHVDEFNRKRDEEHAIWKKIHDEEKLNSLLDLFEDRKKIVLGNTDFNIEYDMNEEFQLTCNGTSDQIKINRKIAEDLIFNMRSI